MANAAKELGYVLVGTNSAGHNAFFVGEDIFKTPLVRLTAEEAFKTPTYRGGRGQNGRMNFLAFQERQRLLEGLPVLNIDTGAIELF